MGMIFLSYCWEGLISPRQEDASVFSVTLAVAKTNPEIWPCLQSPRIFMGAHLCSTWSQLSHTLPES